MRAYIYLSFIINGLGIAAWSINLATQRYPRTDTVPISGDVFKLVFSCGFTAWAAYLLWG